MSQVAIIMGSKSDFEIMSEAIEILKSFDINTEYDIVSAHRTPNKMVEYASNAERKGIKVIIHPHWCGDHRYGYLRWHQCGDRSGRGC